MCFKINYERYSGKENDHLRGSIILWLVTSRTVILPPNVRVCCATKSTLAMLNWCCWGHY